MKNRAVVFLILLSMFSLEAGSAEKPAAWAPWPTEEWTASIPERQGMDSGLLAQFVEQVGAQRLNVHSLMVIRHGYVVAEAYFAPSKPETTRAVYSVTKSVVSALVGIAIAQGSLDGVNHRILDDYPDLKASNDDPRRLGLTVEQVLTMSSGMDWSDTRDLSRIEGASDPVPFLLRLPLASAPGTTFVYNSGAPTLLTALLRKVTGKTPQEFAAEKLFGPIGVSNVFWTTYRTGVQTGGYGIWMNTRDLARFGYLYLRNGTWNGRQILPASWVKASFEKHIDPRMEGEKRSGYGYLWWLQTHGTVAAQGMGGQYILLVPDQALEVVITADLTGQDFQKPYDLYESCILAAIKSDGPLAPNPAQASRLQQALKEARQP